MLAVARPISRMAMAVGTRRFLNQPGLPGLPPLQLLWRADLHRALHDRAVAQGIRITQGKRLVDAEATASGITARFADGSRASADVLIGADGIYSTVRTLIDPDAPGPDYTGLLGFEAITTYQAPAEPDTITFVALLTDPWVS